MTERSPPNILPQPPDEPSAPAEGQLLSTTVPTPRLTVGDRSGVEAWELRVIWALGEEGEGILQSPVTLI